MKNTSNLRITPWFKLFSGTASITVIFLACMVLAGWLFDSPSLKRFFYPRSVAMNPTTAVSFILSSVACLLNMKQASRVSRRIAQVCAIIVILIASMRLISYLWGFELGVDRILFCNALEKETPPNRMAPNTAFCFLIIGVALLLLEARTRRSYYPSQFFSILTALFSIFVLTGYLYGITSFIQVSVYISMALVTSICFAMLSLNVLFLRPGYGLMAIISSPGPGGVLARRLLPVAIFLPELLGWLRLIGQKRGFYGTEFGVGLTTILSIFIFSFLIVVASQVTYRTDIQRRKAEEMIKKYSSQLEVANKELEAFSDSVSHDLRAPLRSMNGFSKVLLEDYADKLDQQGRDYLQRVCNASQHMAELIEDLLNLSRVTRAQIKPEVVNLSVLASGIIDDLKKTEARNIEFVIVPNIIVNGDKNLLRIVLENLIGNAWKFTSKHPKARIEFGMMEKEGGPVYFVRDDGVGFDMAYVDKLFNAFQRLHTATEFSGTGIGLSIVQRIIHRHGGKVWAEGEVEKGAAFCFTLP
jgi:signal transduction histidine kinase